MILKRVEKVEAAVSRKTFGIALLMNLIFLPTIVFSQPSFDLNKLIFEPVLLSEVSTNGVDGLAGLMPNGIAENEGSEKLSEQELSRTLDISQYELSIQELEFADGAFAEGLAEQLGTLASIYQELGDHSEAIELFEKAKHIVRVNHGLFTLQQLAFQENIISSHLALGEVKTADQLEEYVFYINRKNYSPDDPEMQVINREWASWNVESLLRLYNVPTASLPLFNSGKENLMASDYVNIYDGTRESYVPRDELFSSSGGMLVSTVNMGILIEPRLKEARDLYKDMLVQAQRNLSESGATSISSELYSLEIQELQRRLADISFIVLSKMELMSGGAGEYSFGRIKEDNRVTSARVVSRGFESSEDAFEDILAALKNTPTATPVEIALAALDLADWNLLFGHERRAAIVYEEAYAGLKNAGMAEEEIQAVLAPEAELPIPTYSVHEYSRQMQGLNRESVLEYKGYIDIQYRLDRYGNRQSVKVLEVSTDTPPRFRRELLDYLRGQIVRPKIIDGQVARNTDVKLRYYFTY